MTDGSSSAPPPRRKRGTLLDMVRSMGIVALAVLALVFYTSRSTPDRMPVGPDTQATVEAARANATFPVLAASSLPVGWYANYASFDAIDDGHWSYHIGYTDGEDGFFGIDANNAPRQQSNLPITKNGSLDREESVAGLAFKVYRMSEKGDEIWIASGVGQDGNPYNIQLNGANPSAGSVSLETFATYLSATGPIVTEGVKVS